MYDHSGHIPSGTSAGFDAASGLPPERRAPVSSLRQPEPANGRTPGLMHQRVPDGTPPSWLTRMLDEVDYGMLLVSTAARVLYMNHAAQLELDDQHPLQLVDRHLHAQRAQDVAILYDALVAAQQGLRRLVHIGTGVHSVTVSVVPQSLHPVGSVGPDLDPLWSTPAWQRGRGATPSPTLLVLGKRQVCAPLTVQAFARSVALTPTETRVLQLLCEGRQPNDVAREQSVAVSTVRTQIGAIRTKTGTNSIRDLVRRVALLPPLVGALRGGLVK